MKRKPILTIAIVLMLLAVTLFWLRHSTPSQLSQQVNDREAAQPRMEVLADRVISEREARRMSPRSWTPPAVFAAVSAPTPRPQVQRGPNNSRYYETPTTQPLAQELRNQAPSVLAKTPEDGRLYLLPEEIDLHTLRARRMVFDSTALDTIIAGNTSTILAPTTGDEILTLEIHKVKTRSAQSHTLMGGVAGEETTSDVQIVYHDGVIHGTVARYSTGQHLEYRILTDGHMMVRELDSSTMVSACGNGAHTECDGTHDDSSDAEELLKEALGGDVEIVAPAEAVIEADTTGWTTIDVVVGYGQAARVADGGYTQIEARIISAVDRMTTAFGNSAVSTTEMMLLGTIEDPNYVFGGSDVDSMSGELNDLKNKTNGALDTVSDYATQLGSDFVSFILKEADGSAGLASRPGYASIVGRDYLTSDRITFAHELGHNLGCTHGWGDSSQDYHSNYGWRFDPPATVAVRTIMAYDWDWGDGDRVPYYSNPDVLYNGAKTGAVDNYNVNGDATADPRYEVNGLNYTNGATGFNGTHSELGATNAYTIKVGDSLDSRYGATYASNRSTRVSAAVISPSSGTNWSTETTQNIFFIGGDGSDTATIDLYRGGTKIDTLANGLNVATGRNFIWDLSAGLFTGSNYMIRVTISLSGGGTTTIDSDLFSITGLPPNSLKLLSPVGGESWAAGASHEITWSSDLGGDVKIVLLKGGLLCSLISSNTPNDGSFAWTFGQSLIAGSDYKLKITSLENSAKTDVSASNFTILPAPIYYASMDTNPGWDLATGWAYGQPTGAGQDSHGNPDPTSGYNGPNVVGYNLLGDYEGSIGSTRWAKTPVIDCSGRTNVKLNFQRWLGVEGSFDNAYIEVSSNGTAWTKIWENSNVQNVDDDDNSWVAIEHDISTYANNKATVYIRWGMGTTDSSWNFSGWNLDEVLVTGDVAATPYQTWSGGLEANVDSNGDGTNNGVAWVVAASNSLANARALLPVSDNNSDANYFIYTYRRSDVANADSNTTIAVEYGSDLSGWTTAVDLDPGGSSTRDIKITETNNGYTTGVDKVEVKIKKSLFPGGKLFSRLKVDVTE